MSDRSADQMRDEHPRAEEPAGANEGAAGTERELDPGSAPEGAPAGAAGTERELDQGSASEGAPAGAPPPEPEPEDALTEAQRERAEYLALAQRTQADFENYRKRAAKETAAAGRRAKSGLIGELLPVVDNLERALGSVGEQEAHLADGVRLVHSGLIAMLERNGVEQFDPVGEKFDPSFHEALSTREEEGAEPGLVIDVVEKGYSLNDVVLRPARVVVSG